MSLLELFKVVIISITEGVTEWLPISSTGHMILLSEFIKPNVSEKFLEMFLVVIQLGAILAVPTLYFERIFPSNKSDPIERRRVYALWYKILIGTAPAVLLGILIELCGADKWLNSYMVVAVALLAYGIMYIVLPKIISSRRRNTLNNDIDMKDAFRIGMFQALSLVPGTSRSGVTMLGGMLLGKSAVASTEFSFFMAMPVMLGASALKVVKFFASGSVFNVQELMYLLIGILVSYCVSVISIRCLVGFVERHGLRFFGIYRIVLGMIVILIYTVKKCG